MSPRARARSLYLFEFSVSRIAVTDIIMRYLKEVSLFYLYMSFLTMHIVSDNFVCCGHDGGGGGGGDVIATNTVKRFNCAENVV